MLSFDGRFDRRKVSDATLFLRSAIEGEEKNEIESSSRPASLN